MKHINYQFQVSLIHLFYYGEFILFMITFDGRSYDPCHISIPKTHVIGKV